MSLKLSIVYSYLFLIFSVLIHEINSKPPSKITGGLKASINEFPSIVSVRYRGRHICGGSLITTRHVLTAAHCLTNESPYTHQLTHFFTWEVTVASGSDNCVNSKNVNQVSKLDVHPNYKGSPYGHFHDIGVITLANAIVADPQTQYPIDLPTSFCDAGLYGTVAGWGTTYPRERNTSEILQKAPATTISNMECRRRTYNIVDDGQLCAFYRKGTGFCDGDSGGPLITKKTVVGVVSLSYGCAMGYPDVYTRVFSYISWIKEKINA